jgi:hypothetical protein
VVPSLDQFERIWRDLAAQGGPMRLEDAFAAAMIERGIGEDYTLAAHVSQLLQAKRNADVIELARAVLASGAEFPTNWYPTLAELSIAAGKLDEAEPIVREVVSSLEAYKPEMLATAMRYHAARGERDVEAMLYHAGMQWFTAFSYEVPPQHAEQYTTEPADLPQQFLAWLERWLGETHWKPAAMTNLAHWLVWFDKIGADVCAQRIAEFAAERDRRDALLLELAQAPDEVTARAFVDQLAPAIGSEAAFRAFTTFHTRAPLAAYQLLDRGIANDRREGFRYHTGERVNAVICLTYLALNHSALDSVLPSAYDIARGYILVKNPALHFNLACCACRLGKRTGALGHIARALELGFADPRQIQDDNDLAPLRGDPVFEKLFVDDAARRSAAARGARDAMKATKQRSKKRVDKKPTTKKRAKKPAAKKPATKKPAEKKPAAAKKSAATKNLTAKKKPAAKKPAAKKKPKSKR